MMTTTYNTPAPFTVRARTTDPETSHLAAASIDESTLRDSQRAVLRVLRNVGVGMTDETLIATYRAAWSRDARGRIPQQSESGIRTRRKELATMGLVVDSGERARLASGRNAIVWIAA